MINFLILALAVMSFTKSFASAAGLTVAIEYRHRDINVKFPLKCTFGSTSNLISQKDSKSPWRINVTPKDLGNGLVSINTIVTENAVITHQSEIISKIGEEAVITSTGPQGDAVALRVLAK